MKSFFYNSRVLLAASVTAVFLQTGALVTADPKARIGSNPWPVLMNTRAVKESKI